MYFLLFYAVCFQFIVPEISRDPNYNGSKILKMIGVKNIFSGA